MERRRGPAQGRDDAKFDTVARQHAPVGVARLEFEIVDRDRLAGAADQSDRNRLGAERLDARLIREPPHKLRAFRNLAGAGEPNRNVNALADADRGARGACDDEPWLLQVRQTLREPARMVRRRP